MLHVRKFTILEKYINFLSIYRSLIIAFIEVFYVSIAFSFLYLDNVDIYINSNRHLIDILIVINIWVFLSLIFRKKIEKIRFSNYTNILYFIIRSFIFLIIFYIVFHDTIYLKGWSAFFNFSFFIINANIFTLYFLRQLIRRVEAQGKRSVIIYETDTHSLRLANVIAFSETLKVVGFLSAEEKPAKKMLMGLPVFSGADLKKIKQNLRVNLIILQQNDHEGLAQNNVLKKAVDLKFSLGTLPSTEKMLKNEIKLKAIDPEALLGRRHAFHNSTDFKDHLHNKTVLISGGGGSIGSEICRQLILYSPSKLIILDFSEYALYQIKEELDLIETDVDIVFVLGSVTDEFFLKNLFKSFKIDVVFHAAAYKHVHIVEENVISGLNNNVFGTKLIAELASRNSVEKFILISSDKAVRPANIMGVSKRLCELICLSLFVDSETVFAAVRFGNVLGSSGSVVPKFKGQIDKGGPVTVTHSKITRYFMTVNEAVHLVLAASSLAKNGDLFLIDMGEPEEIKRLAEKLIQLHGLIPVVASEKNNETISSDDEIEIEFAGLRPGEKLYEELLISGEATPSEVNGIFLAKDPIVDRGEVISVLNQLKELLSRGDTVKVIQFLEKIPVGYLSGRPR